jgi:hypothetical protein
MSSTDRACRARHHACARQLTARTVRKRQEHRLCRPVLRARSARLDHPFGLAPRYLLLYSACADDPESMSSSHSVRCVPLQQLIELKRSRGAWLRRPSCGHGSQVRSTEAAASRKKTRQHPQSGTTGIGVTASGPGRKLASAAARPPGRAGPPLRARAGWRLALSAHPVLWHPLTLSGGYTGIALRSGGAKGKRWWRVAVVSPSQEPGQRHPSCRRRGPRKDPIRTGS